MLMSSSDTNYVRNEREDLGHRHPFTVQSQMMPCYSYPASVVNQHSMPFKL